MNSMAGILVSPGFDAKILERKAIWKAKCGDVKFKDILRQRCRRRIRENREQLISRCRGLDSPELKRPLADIVKEEINQFMMLFESGYMEEEWDEVNWETPKEMISDQDEWLMNQFNGMLDDTVLSSILDEIDSITCPLCLKGILRQTSPGSIIKCERCAKNVSGCTSLSEINTQISRCLNTHSESGCCSNVSFFAADEDQTPQLFIICSSCGYLDIVG